VDAFIPDYRLAPEHRFPAAIRDAEACYRALVGRGIKYIALTGDSAGGNLALVLLSIATAQAASGGTAPVGAAVLSPVIDLALTGESFETRAEADPYFIKPQVAALVCSYLGESDPKNPLASPLHGDLLGLPQSASTWEMMRCCSTTCGSMSSAPLLPVSTASSTYGWEWRTGSLMASGSCTRHPRHCAPSERFCMSR